VAFSYLPSTESRDLADDIQELFAELATTLKHEHRAFTGECHPPIDVRETERTFEVVLDVAGIPPQALRVLFRSDVLLVAGEKAPPPATEEQTYHLVEREFGRFARAVRINGAFDIEHATATIDRGALVIILPKLEERRGRSHRIRVVPPSREP
jgi:HSP20 family protein